MNFLSKKIKNICMVLFFITFMLIYINVVFAVNHKSENDKWDVLINIGIIDDTSDMEKFVTRSDFAKMIVKASPYANSIGIYDVTSSCNDVPYDDINANFIKTALLNKYMFSYLGGLFKPYDYVTYSDVCRACLSLLGYKNEDFTGNKVTGYNNKFADLSLNEYIDKSYTDFLTKADICNAIYNTLKAKIKDEDSVYGTNNFDKLSVDIDGELLIDDKTNDTISGPIIIKSKDDIQNVNNFSDYTLYLNGIKNTYEELVYDIENFNYAVLYYNHKKKLLYAYTERADVDSPVALKKGYVTDIEYTAMNMILPYRVSIMDNFYFLESEEAKFDFSYAGNIKIGDYIYFLSNKYNDKTKAYLDENNKKHADNDDAIIYVGSIVTVYKGKN